MTILTYLFIGVVFAFCVDFFITTESFKQEMKNQGRFGNFIISYMERFLMVFFWPICLAIFLYNFFKQMFK